MSSATSSVGRWWSSLGRRFGSSGPVEDTPTPPFAYLVTRLDPQIQARCGEDSTRAAGRIARRAPARAEVLSAGDLEGADAVRLHGRQVLLDLDVLVVPVALHRTRAVSDGGDAELVEDRRVRPRRVEAEPSRLARHRLVGARKQAHERVVGGQAQRAP